MSDYVAPLTAVLLPHVGAVVGGIFVQRNLDAWYEGLKYPSWRPPNQILPIVWTTLYTSMGYASYLVWKDGGGFRGPAALPLAWYGAQLALSWAWTPIFFGLRSLKWAFVDGVFLCGGIAGTIYMFYGINKTASYLLLPYLAWATFASTLNFRIWKDNSDQKKE
uniref:Peripheral-type benzodiazepine receptor n=1 Tax=Arion vulgaris TaxID=1028688 RepID=A0A0B6YUX9_9EUPU